MKSNQIILSLAASILIVEYNKRNANMIITHARTKGKSINITEEIVC